jgi:RNA recognition motif-containing protein
LGQVASEVIRLDKVANEFSQGKSSMQQSTFDEAKVYVANMTPDVTEESMRKHFEKHGKVVSTRVFHRHSKSANGSVEFFDGKTAKEVLQTRIHEMDGRRLYVNTLRPRNSFNSRKPLTSTSSRTNRYFPY